MEKARRQVETLLDDETIDTIIQEIIDSPSKQDEFGDILLSLAERGESSQEVAGFAKAMRSRMNTVSLQRQSIDVCGTGGDGSNTFNISTAAAFVVAGAGMPVAKHGNRAATSRSGSADVLESLGVRLTVEPDANANFNFLFAPEYHPAMKAIAPVRKKLGRATIFNTLGPILNPANVRYQMIGTPSSQVAERIAYAARDLGYKRMATIYNGSSVDELVTCTDNFAIEVSDRQVTRRRISPSDHNLVPADHKDLRGGTPAENAGIITSILHGETGERRDTVVLNAAYALLLQDATHSLYKAIHLAKESIDSGAAQAELEMLVKR